MTEHEEMRREVDGYVEEIDWSTDTYTAYSPGSLVDLMRRGELGTHPQTGWVAIGKGWSREVAFLDDEGVVELRRPINDHWPIGLRLTGKLAPERADS